MKNQSVKPHQHQLPTTKAPHQPHKIMWLTIEEAAVYARVSKRTIYNWRKDGLPESKRNRKMIRISSEDIDKFLLRSYSTICPDAVAHQVDSILDDLMK